MRYEDFIKRVQGYADIEDWDEAVQATEATLETLGERLPKTEKEQLASELVAELKGFVLKRAATARFDLEEFFERVSARADIGFPDAVKKARAVVMALREAVSPGELQDVIGEFPDEYDELFKKRPEEPLSPPVSS